MLHILAPNASQRKALGSLLRLLVSLVRSVVEPLERIDKVISVPTLDKAGEHAHGFPVFVLELVEDPIELLVLEARLVVEEDLGVRVSLGGRVLACAAGTGDVVRFGPRLDHLVRDDVLRLPWACYGGVRATLVCGTWASSLFVLILPACATTCNLVVGLNIFLLVVSGRLHCCWCSRHVDIVIII